jgi:hypothetical protein
MLSRRRLPAITASLARRVANESALCFDVGGPAAACAPASLAGDKERVGFAAWRATMGASLSTSTSASFSFPALAGGGGGPRPLAPSAAALSSAAGSLQGSLAGSSLASKALAARPPSSRLVSMSGRASSGGSSGSGSGAALPAAARGPSIRSFSSAAAAAAAVTASIALLAVAPLSPSSCDAAAADDDADKPTRTGSKASASASASAPAPPAAATTALPSCPLCHAAPWVLALSTSPETTEILSGEALAASARRAVPAGASTSPSSPSVPSATPSPPPLASDPGSQGRQQQQQQHRQHRQQRPPGAPQQAGARARAPPFLGGDHMFSALLRHDLVRDLVALYQPAQKTMRYVIQLVRDGRGERGGLDLSTSPPSPLLRSTQLENKKNRAQTPAATRASSTAGSPRRSSTRRWAFCSTRFAPTASCPSAGPRSRRR